MSSEVKYTGVTFTGTLQRKRVQVHQQGHKGPTYHHFLYDFPGAKHLACANELDCKIAQSMPSAKSSIRMRIAPVSLWTRVNCSILPNLLDLFKIYIVLIHFLLACRSCGPWPFHAWRQYDHTHLAKKKKGHLSKVRYQNNTCRMKLVLPRLIK